MQLNKIVVSSPQNFCWASPLLWYWYSSSNNLLVRILVIRILLFEVSSCDVLIFISIMLEIFGMKCISFLFKNTLIHVIAIAKLLCSLRTR